MYEEKTVTCKTKLTKVPRRPVSGIYYAQLSAWSSQAGSACDASVRHSPGELLLPRLKPGLKHGAAPTLQGCGDVLDAAAQGGKDVLEAMAQRGACGASTRHCPRGELIPRLKHGAAPAALALDSRDRSSCGNREIFLASFEFSTLTISSSACFFSQDEYQRRSSTVCLDGVSLGA